MFLRSTALLAIAVLAAGCSSGGSNSGITGAVPPAQESVGASIGASPNTAASFSIAGNTPNGILSAQGNTLSFSISESVQGNSTFTSTFTVTPNPASCIRVTSTDGTNFTATANCTTLPTSGNYTVTDNVGTTAPLVITAAP